MANEFAELAERITTGGSRSEHRSERGDRGAQRSEFDITAGPRAVIRESARLLSRMLGEDVFGDARANALQAVRADQQRARERAELARLLDPARHSR